MFVCNTYWKTEDKAGGGVAGLAGDANAHPYVSFTINLILMMPKKSLVSHTTLAHSKQHLQSKREDLAESTDVVPAEYPPKVKLELLTTLEYQRGVKNAYLGLWGYWGFYSSIGLISLGRILRDPFLIGILSSSIKYGEQDISLYTKSWVASKPVSGSSALPHSSIL